LIAIIIDIIVLSVLLISFFRGFRHGAIKSFLLLINSVISWIFSVYVSRFISSLAFNYFISPVLLKEFRSILKIKNLEADGILKRLPEVLVNSLPQYGITLSKATHIINSVSSEVLPCEIVKLFAPAVTEILISITSVLLFILTLSLGKLIIKFLLKLFRIKFLNYSDRVAGGIFGAFKGYVLILIFACIFRISAPFLGSYINLEDFEVVVSSTIAFKHVYNQNPLYVFFKRV